MAGNVKADKIKAEDVGTVEYPVTEDGVYLLPDGSIVDGRPEGPDGATQLISPGSRVTPALAARVEAARVAAAGGEGVEEADQARRGEGVETATVDTETARPKRSSGR